MKDQTLIGKFTSTKKALSIICLTLLVSWAFILWHHNYQRQKIDLLLTQFESAKKAKKELLRNYDMSLLTLDSLSGEVNADEKLLIDKNAEIKVLRSDIDRLLYSETANVHDNQQAEKLIQRLNSRIDNLFSQIRDLRSSNQLLSQQRDEIAGEKEKYRKLKEELETQVNQLALKTQVASTLVTDTLYVKALKSRKGNNDHIVKNFRRADKFLLSFDVYNRIIEAGQTNIGIKVVDPDGNLVGSSISGVTADSMGDDQQFTVILPIDIQPSVQTKVEYQWAKLKNYKKGNYLIAVYHNGFKIAERMMHLS